jgi:hypothetical protein
LEIGTIRSGSIYTTSASNLPTPKGCDAVAIDGKATEEIKIARHENASGPVWRKIDFSGSNNELGHCVSQQVQSIVGRR